MVFWESQIYNQSEVFGWEKFVEKQGNRKGKKDALCYYFLKAEVYAPLNSTLKIIKT